MQILNTDFYVWFIYGFIFFRFFWKQVFIHCPCRSQVGFEQNVCDSFQTASVAIVFTIVIIYKYFKISFCVLYVSIMSDAYWWSCVRPVSVIRKAAYMCAPKHAWQQQHQWKPSGVFVHLLLRLWSLCKSCTVIHSRVLRSQTRYL